jgi:two-component system, chemotaxis family, CheB/CheR fusion protein
MNLDQVSEPQQTQRASRATPSPEVEELEQYPFPIVAIGASAGGLEAISQLLAHLPPETGMAFILVQHLDPHHDSQLSELLANKTRMPVIEATDGVAVCPDQVYVIPPNANLGIDRGLLQVTLRGDAPGLHLPVDWLFRSLAKDQQARAIGVVLSGTGSDGALGVSEIKAAGGITFAQDEQSAKHWGMPSSAIDTGCVDFVLPPEAIARRLAEVGGHPYLSPGPSIVDVAEDDVNFKRILAAVRAATGVDFTQYRDTTIRRRIMRRMALRTQRSLADYVRLLEVERAEVDALYRDLLINVTSFFRDPEMFEMLKRSVLPDIMKSKAPNAPVRVWVAGCSTGQEAYSLGMTVLEFFDDKPVRPVIQIFATDLSDAPSLERARIGLYPESIETEVSPERLRRFFRKEGNLYRIDKAIRDLCVFARQNITADPPFSHVDLITCRNVLIYMASPLQKRVLPMFHYALNPTGFLVLGSSETVGEFTGLFEQVDRGHKIYAKKAASMRLPLHFSADGPKGASPVSYRVSAPSATPLDFQKEADRLLLRHYAPPGVLVNGNFDILQFRGRTSAYLEPPPGEPTMNVLKMAREGLFLELRTALNEAKASDEAVRRERVIVRDNQGMREVNLQVLPVPPPTGDATDCLLVLFEDAGALASASLEPSSAASGTAPASGSPFTTGLRSWWRRALSPRSSPVTYEEGNGVERGRASTTERELAALRQELTATKEYLQSLIEQQDAANEELRSANEEILSSNEELQSTNEELETAKEELQSSNEELTTVNEQLQYRNVELNQTTNDLTNLLTSTTLPMIMVGKDLRIRRMTAAARKVMNLLPADVGRPIGDLRTNADVPDLEILITQVIEQVHMQEREIQDIAGRWYVLRIHPYRTMDDKIDGAVITLLDIDEVKRAQKTIRDSEEQFRRALEDVPIPIIMQAEDGEVLQISRCWTELTGYTLKDIPTFKLWLTEAYGFGAENIRNHAHHLFEPDADLADVEFDILTRFGEKRTWRFSTSVPGKLHDGRRFIVGMALDITDGNRVATMLAEADTSKRSL